MCIRDRTRRDPWILRLSKVISKNYCCESFSRREKGKQTYKLYFCGLNEDVEICMIAFKYATDCIQSEIKKRKQKGKLFNYTNELVTSKMCIRDRLCSKANKCSEMEEKLCLLQLLIFIRVKISCIQTKIQVK